MKKERLDMALLRRGLVESREKAKAYIMAGDVQVNDRRCDKPAQAVLETDEITLRRRDEGFVSRGGWKLERAITEFHLDVTDRVALDIGASTGGFTDCMLRHGARKVYAVDVGYGQLAYPLRQDARVVVMERTNARYLQKESFKEAITFISMDVSFISLKLIFPAVARCAEKEATMVALIKPQFEAGRGQVGKNGVVIDPEIHCAVLTETLQAAAEQGFTPIALTYSPLRGPKGNIEFLCAFQYKGNPVKIGMDMQIQQIVRQAHKNL